jgi:hypothetical protein
MCQLSLKCRKSARRHAIENNFLASCLPQNAGPCGLSAARSCNASLQKHVEGSSGLAVSTSIAVKSFRFQLAGLDVYHGIPLILRAITPEVTAIDGCLQLCMKSRRVSSWKHLRMPVDAPSPLLDSISSSGCCASPQSRFSIFKNSPNVKIFMQRRRHSMFLPV